MGNLAGSYAAAGRPADSLKLYEQLLTLMRKRLGNDHPDTFSFRAGSIEALVALKRFDEALMRIEELLGLALAGSRSGAKVDPSLVPSMLGFRSRIMRDRKDVVGMRRTAEQWEDLKRTDADSLFDAARYRCLLARMLADRPAEAKADGDKAMAWLTKAVAAGWKDRSRLETDEDLTPLRARDDFRKLVASLPKGNEPAPKPPDGK